MADNRELVGNDRLCSFNCEASLVASPAKPKTEEWNMPLGRSMATAGLVIASGLSLSACATKDYVNQQVATVNDRVTALESRVATVDQTAQAANSTAQSAAGAAQQANQRLDQLTARVDSMEQQMASKRPRN